MSDAKVMPVPEIVPVLVNVVENWLGRKPEKVESLYGQVRWTWNVNREEFDGKFHAKWEAHEKEFKNLPGWYRQWHVISVLWPSQDKFVVNVILRDSAIDFWCLPNNVRREHPTFVKLFCEGCGWARDHCKCPK